MISACFGKKIVAIIKCRRLHLIDCMLGYYEFVYLYLDGQDYSGVGNISIRLCLIEETLCS